MMRTPSRFKPPSSTSLQVSRFLRITIVSLSIHLMGTGCAVFNSREQNPEIPKAGSGYVDFYTTSESQLYAWIIAWNRDDRNRTLSDPKLTEESFRSGGFPFGPLATFFRVECAPGPHR